MAVPPFSATFSFADERIIPVTSAIASDQGSLLSSIAGAIRALADTKPNEPRERKEPTFRPSKEVRAKIDGLKEEHDARVAELEATAEDRIAAICAQLDEAIAAEETSREATAKKMIAADIDAQRKQAAATRALRQEAKQKAVKTLVTTGAMARARFDAFKGEATPPTRYPSLFSEQGRDILFADYRTWSTERKANQEASAAYISELRESNEEVRQKRLDAAQADMAKILAATPKGTSSAFNDAFASIQTATAIKALEQAQKTIDSQYKSDTRDLAAIVKEQKQNDMVEAKRLRKIAREQIIQGLGNSFRNAANTVIYARTSIPAAAGMIKDVAGITFTGVVQAVKEAFRPVQQPKAQASGPAPKV